MSTFNDGYVNFPGQAYEACEVYLKQWRPEYDSDKEHLFVWPDSGRPVTSQDLGKCCKIYFQEINQKDFCFTDFRQFMQSVFAQTSSNPAEKNGSIE